VAGRALQHDELRAPLITCRKSETRGRRGRGTVGSVGLQLAVKACRNGSEGSSASRAQTSTLRSIAWSCHASRPTLAKRNCPLGVTDMEVGGPSSGRTASTDVCIRVPSKQPIGKLSTTTAADADCSGSDVPRNRRKRLPYACCRIVCRLGLAGAGVGTETPANVGLSSPRLSRRRSIEALLAAGDPVRLLQRLCAAA
jgi:hypothetical protein